MIIAMLEGYCLGLALVILIGPVLFVLMNATLERGLSNGIAVALGIFVSDLLVVWLCYQGSGELATSELGQRWLAFGGGLITLSLGLKYLISPTLKRPPLTPDRQEYTQAHHLSSLAHSWLKGFGVNFINPFVFIVWLGIISIAQQRYPQAEQHIGFLIMTLGGILTLDLGKAFYAHRLIPALAPLRLKQVQRVSGVILALFSVRLFFDSCQK